MDNECFYHLVNLPEVAHEYATEAALADFAPPTTVGDPRLTPRTTRASSTFIRTKFCRDLENEFGQVYAEYLKFDPMTGYDWHTDIGRNFAINFLLTPTNSLTIFRQPLDILNYKLTVCDYTLFCPTLFNTQVMHSVINNSADTRYVLSVYVKKPVEYNSVREWLLDYKTDSY